VKLKENIVTGNNAGGYPPPSPPQHTGHTDCYNSAIDGLVGNCPGSSTGPIHTPFYKNPLFIGLLKLAGITTGLIYIATKHKN